jgi:hypothetical protein
MRTFNYLVVLHFYSGSCNNYLLYYPVMSFLCLLLLQLFMNIVAFSLFTLLALILSYFCLFTLLALVLSYFCLKHPEHPVIVSFI